MKGNVLSRPFTTISPALFPLFPFLCKAPVWRLLTVKAFVMFSAFLSSTVLSGGATPNPKLVALVPPSAQIVAGLNVPPRSGQPSTFLLTTHSGTIDLNDFLAISGVDSGRAFDQIIMVAANGDRPYSAHSIIVTGRFNQELVYKSVYQTGAKAIRYRGVAILEMQPFARERDNFYDVPWLAMMDSRLAILGTPSLVQIELDRYLNDSQVDPSLERRLSLLRHDDVSWCIAKVKEGDTEIQPIFRMLDSRFADLLRTGDTIQFGIRYGRQVEFDYEIGPTSDPNAEAVQRSLAEPVADDGKGSTLPVSTFNRANGGVRGVLKVPKWRYETWLAETVANIRPDK